MKCLDQETLYTATKWDVLKLLEERQLSPIEISQITGGSLANISHTLRLLEMAGLVKSERVPNRDKGQPRVLYSLAEDSCYVINTSSNFVDKKRLTLGPSHQVVLRIWFLDNPELRTYCEKAFWKVEEHLPDLQGLYLDLTTTSPVSLYVVADKTLEIPAVQEIRDGNDTRSLTVTQISKEKLTDLGGDLFKLYEC